MGSLFSLVGCSIIILINIFLIPVFGYMACAWAGFAGYGVAMLLSYFVGQKKYPINYDLKAIGNYVVLALVLYIVSVYLPIQIYSCCWVFVHYCCYCLWHIL